MCSEVLLLLSLTCTMNTHMEDFRNILTILFNSSDLFIMKYKIEGLHVTEILILMKIVLHGLFFSRNLFCVLKKSVYTQDWLITVTHIHSVSPKNKFKGGGDI